MENKKMKMIKYDDLVKEWKDEKKQMIERTSEDRIYRWNPDGMYNILENTGKVITDNNPYVNLVDIEEFDLVIENEPYTVAPPPMNKVKNKIKSKSASFFGLMHKEITGDPMNYMKDQKISMERINNEAQGIDVPKPEKQKEKDLLKLKKEIFEYAKSLGFASAGVTKIDRRYVSMGVDDEIIFDTIILLGYEIPEDVMGNYPNPKGELGAFGAYTGCARNVHKVADFIRSKGYDCRARGWDGSIKYSPHAVNAGLGNYSTYGVCVTPEAGTRLKYCSILIDADLVLDKPKDFNIEEFCSRCRMCQKSCPSNSIPKEEKKYKGSIKRQTRFSTCLELMTTAKECLKCVRVCPFSMIGYEQCMESLPQYYMYNLERDQLDKEFLLSKKEGENNE
ncbi:hypothetical protein [Tepidibacter hydrothermalis]|uniref:4Fe-4S ferredoxin-type domain-containing protein n=1 Tax=Tepidibacter hydrothermalis TaxID=3036126 RepID=A0ABY8EG66_9FIRM|nr:hypothetical protein [Tepidibacter hydrothermalis]WFD11949.1 hypothetical protein P4S50_07695 [Tepidibacter hydrothermalis]